MDNFLNLVNNFSVIDYIFLLFIIFFACLGLNKGFVLSLLSFLKWIVAFVSVKILLPIITPYTENIIKSEFAHDAVVGIVIFIISIFLIMLIMKGMKKTMSWTGLGAIDKFFGFSILGFSNFIPTIYFGLFTGMAMITALVLVLTLLPRLLIQFAPKNNG